MSNLYDIVSDCQDELLKGESWVAFWKDGESWYKETICTDLQPHTIYAAMGALNYIKDVDPHAVILSNVNAGKDMSLNELLSVVELSHNHSINTVANFIAKHDPSLSPEELGKMREKAHNAGLAFCETPYFEEDYDGFDPYCFDGHMSIEDYDFMHECREEGEEKKRDKNPYLDR